MDVYSISVVTMSLKLLNDNHIIMIKGLKDMEDRIRSYNLIAFQVERILRKEER